MEIRELEQAIKAIMRMDSGGSAQLALSGANGIGVRLPEEFALAVQTLSERTGKLYNGESILHKAFRWG